MKDKIEIKKGASHADVTAEFKKLGLTARDTKPKAKKVRPRRLRRSKLATKPAAEPKKVKKAVKKTVKKAAKEKPVAKPEEKK